MNQKGLPLVVEARSRVFPKSQKATDVFRVMKEYVSHPNVTILTASPVTRIEVKKNTITGVYVKGNLHTAKNYLIATGGVSHEETGSSGDGFKWLKKIGHTVHTPRPTIVPLKVSDSWVKKLSGTSLSFMRISFFVNGKRNFSEKGKILFTHFGISGPLILNAAHKVADLLHEGDVSARIDCYPDTEINSLEKQILKVFDKNKNKSFKNIIKEVVPQGLSDTLLDFNVIFGDEKVHSIPKEARKEFVHLLKALPLTITGLMGMDRAVISDGGIPLTEINMKTMKSTVLFSNLYITGDMLHVNRPSGGYSLQLCWTTGYVAGLLG